MPSRFVVRSFLTLVSMPWVFMPCIAPAQTPNARLVGHVTDSSHAAVAGAMVRVKSVATNEVRTVQTTVNGDYTVSNLAPGKYEVTIEKEGFRQLHESNLELQVEQTARLDARLEVGTVSQSVEVKADVPLINTETFSRGDVISSSEIREMPLNGRDFNDLAFMVPGVQAAEQGGKGSPYVVNGARADASNVVIDGFNDQNPRDAGAQARPPLESLQEFKLQTSGYSAEYGRLAGGVISMVLKSGGNQVHGSAFEFLRNDLFDARNFFDAGKSKLRRNQFGASLDGPLVIPKLYDGHDRTFYLLSWESFRGIEGETNLGIVPTELEREGDFSQSVDASGKRILLKDPLASGSCTATISIGCFPGNVIPPNRISPIAAQILQNYPLPNVSGVNNYRANANINDAWDSFLFKVDQRLTSKDSLAGRLLKRWESSTDPFSGSQLGTFGATTDNVQALYGISETRIFTPTIVNEARIGLTRTTNNQLSVHRGRNWAATYGIPGTTDDLSLAGFPKFSITGYETLGDSTTLPIRYVVNNFNWNDVLTWTRGRHTLKMGGEILRVQYYQPTNSNFNGTFTFNGKLTNNGFADFLLGFPSSTSRKIGTVTNHIFSTNFGLFLQDDFNIHPNLTLNLGLRYEVQVMPYEQAGQETSFVPALGKVIMADNKTVPNLDAILSSAGLTGQIGLAADYGLPKSLVNTDYENFAPRVGFAWRPFGNNRTVVRSGYGIFYTGMRLSAIRTDLTGGFPFAISQSFTGSAMNPNLLTIANPFPASLAKISGVTQASGFDLNPSLPYLQSWNLTLERELVPGVALEIGYSGSKGVHLGRKYDINQAVRTPLASVRPYPLWGDIEYYSFGSNSSYNAGTVTVRKRFNRGLFFRANYTFGKSLDTASGLNYAGDGGYQGAQDSRNLSLERGRSDFDIRHVFSMNFAWELPLRKNRLLHGWQLAGSGIMYSGQPFTPQLTGPNRDLGFATRPDRIASGALSNPTADMWFDLSAFPIVPDTAYRFGTSGRNILDGPGNAAINLALSRFFPIGEHSRLQFRWETFNATNHANLYLPAVAIDKNNAGTITQAKSARVMQFGVRYQF
jgi:outer membrane receptor protein involved in Fe transport